MTTKSNWKGEAPARTRCGATYKIGVQLCPGIECQLQPGHTGPHSAGNRLDWKPTADETEGFLDLHDPTRQSADK